MTTKKLFALAVSALFVFTSCNQDEPAPEVNDGRVHFASGISGVQTRVGGTKGDEWDGNESIGIFMVKNATSEIAEKAENILYTTTSIGKSATFTSTTPIYYPVDIDTKVDFVAYHPYDKNNKEPFPDELYEISLTDQTNQSAIDFMYARADNDGKSFNKENNQPVNLVFNHILSKLVLNVLKGDGVTDDLQGLEVKIKGVNTTCIFNFETGKAEGEGLTLGEALIPYNAGNNTFEAIIAPNIFNDIDDTYLVEFTVGGNTYTWKMLDNIAEIKEFESGKKYTFNITLTKNKVKATGKIEPWEPVGAIQGTAK
ncbi:MAG TPA: hypothetical protein DDW85_06265 [Porphyromonadaceae bacterium]|jgi:hypothetical protein|nr:hypothetical protein [Porphyromonadaceae bacterium]